MNMLGHELLTKKQMFLNAVQYGFHVLSKHMALLGKAFGAFLLGFLLPIYACMILVMLAGSALYMHLFYQQELAYDISLVIAFGIGALLAVILICTIAFAGIIRFFFELHDRADASIRTLFSGTHYLLRFIAFGILLTFMLSAVTGVALVLSEFINYVGRAMHYDATLLSLITMVSFATIAGMILFIRFTYSLYAVVDSDSPVVPAMRRSYRLTKDFVLWLLLLHIIVYLPVSLFSMLLETIHGDNLPVIVDVLIFQGLPLLVGLMAIVISICARIRLYRLLQARHVVIVTNVV
jgi:hypothetical protein